MTTLGFSRNADPNLPSRTFSHGGPTKKKSYFSRLRNLGYIVSLRKKLEADPATPRLLVSVRGAGYKLEHV